MQYKKLTLAAAAAGLFVVGAASGLTAPALVHNTATDASSTAAAALPTGPIPLTTAPNYRAIVAQSGPAVVGIFTEGKTGEDTQRVQRRFNGPSQSPFGDDPFLQFFRQMPQPREMPTRSLGSGFIVSGDGLILTNAHVVRDAKRVTVKLSDHREFKAKVLGSDPATDIAVLKIDASGLPTVRLGDSDQLAVGDYVLAIGQPYGFEASATSGIVSAKGRTLPGDGAVQFIQTDVPVNPGNSGGPLFDSSGAVVGINSQIYTNTGGYEGLSFAIPIKLALNIKAQLVANGKVEHARLGVEVQPLTQALADSFGLKTPQGALIAKVAPDSAAAKAGLQAGDVILSYNGEAVSDFGDLSTRVGMAKPEDTATLDVWRDRKSQTIKAKLGAATQVAAADSDDDSAAHGKLGLAVRPLTPEEREQAGVPGGLLVQDARGAAAEAGIQPGDVLLSVDGKPIRSVEQLRDAARHGDKQLALLVQRGDDRLFVPVELG